MQLAVTQKNTFDEDEYDRIAFAEIIEEKKLARNYEAVTPSQSRGQSSCKKLNNYDMYAKNK